MTHVSTEYGVLCSETSLVAVERLKDKVEGEAKPIVIPIAITKDSGEPNIQMSKFSGKIGGYFYNDKHSEKR